MASDGSLIAVSDGDRVRLAGGPVLLETAEVVAAGAVDGAIWLVVAGPSGHELHRFDRGGRRLGEVAALGALGAGVVMASLRVGVRCALIEGDRAVLVSERDGQLAVEVLGERGRDRRALIGGRGVVERHGASLAWLRRGALPSFALPFDLTGASVVGGAMVLDGAAALIELDRNGQRTALVFDLRRGEVRSRIRLGEAQIMAIAERKGMLVLGRGSSVALFDLRASCCVGERILPAPLAACAIDALATRVVIVDAHGDASELGAAMTNAVSTTVRAPQPAHIDDAATVDDAHNPEDARHDHEAADQDHAHHRAEHRTGGDQHVGADALEHGPARAAPALESPDHEDHPPRPSTLGHDNRAPNLRSHAAADNHRSHAGLAHNAPALEANHRNSVAAIGDRHRHAALAPALDASAVAGAGDRHRSAALAHQPDVNRRSTVSIIGGHHRSQPSPLGADRIRLDTSSRDRAIPSPTAVTVTDSTITASPALSTADLDAPADNADDRDHALDADDPRIAAAQLTLEALEPAARAGLDDDALDDYLADVRAWVEALCDSVLALAGGDAAQQTASRADELHATERLSQWHRRAAPHAELARELGLSPIAATLLLLIAAPQIWGELASRYGRCVDDPARPLIDELLLAHLLEAGTAARVAIARELDADAPLVASGAIELGRGLRPYAALSAHPAIARRLAGGGRTALDATAPTLRSIRGPRAAIAALAHQLATAPVDGQRARVVLRGRPGSGRRTLGAALAAQAGRRLTCIAISDAVAGPELEATLRRRLRDAALRGELPCVDLDGLAEEPGVHARLRAVLDDHRGPLMLRAASLGEVPLAPGYAGLELPPLSETERAATWAELLAARGAPAAISDLASSLAARFAVGVGAMIRACASLPRATPVAALETALATALRQHRSARIAAVATRVDSLARWDDLVVTDDIADALREVCARVRHRRLVLEGWGMERAAATAQGVTALFQGGPGTGKTMAAGVIARALGFELWRVDLSKVVSKWIGETEKNLAAVFDAAEQGEIVLLFDEADSLFAKRTQVNSSNDRNANLETNYLLQRLDSFTGVAILTTNAGTAIDTAFKRRMSVHVQFPFPDDHDRERLWRAHLPASLPIHGALDLATLARNHALSGGYIRNACLRAAYLAASDGGRLTDDHLQRAVALEYQRAGNLGGGRLE